MLRSAAAAGVDQVVLSKHCAFAWSPKVLRAGQGAHFLIDDPRGRGSRRMVDAFRAAGRAMVARPWSHGAPILYATDLRGRVALAIGNEGAGLSRVAGQGDAARDDPDAGGCESLNAAAAAAVVCSSACGNARTRHRDHSAWLSARRRSLRRYTASVAAICAMASRAGSESCAPEVRHARLPAATPSRIAVANSSPRSSAAASAPANASPAPVVSTTSMDAARCWPTSPRRP